MDRDACIIDSPPDLRERVEAAVRKNVPDLDRMSPEEVRDYIHELRVSLAERELRNEAVRQACEKFSKRTDEALSLLECSPDVIVRLDRDLRIQYANPAFEQVTGIPAEKATGHGFHEWTIPENQVASWESNVRSVFDTGREATMEFEYAGTEGPRYYHARTVPEHYEDGRLASVLVTVHDITELALARKKLRESEERFRVISELISNYAYSYRVEPDSRLTVEWVVGAFEDITGYTPEEANVEGDFIAVVHPDDQEKNQRRLKILLSGHEERTRLRYVAKNGEVHWMQDNARPVYDENGQIAHIIGATADISDLKRTEEELRTTKDDLEEQVWRRTVELEKNIENLRKEIAGRKQAEEELTKHREHLEELVRERTAKLEEEIEERKQVEEALRESETRFRQLADSMPQLVWTAEPDGRVDYYNMRYKDYQGINRTHNGVYEWGPVLHPEDREPTVAAFQHAIRTGETYQVEHRVKMADGRYRWHLSRGIPAYDEQGRIVKWFGAATDIHDVKTAQEALREREERTQRLNESLKRMTLQLASSNKELEAFSYSVSHDLRAPLRSLDGFSLALLEDYSDRLDAEGRNYLNRIRSAAQRMSQLIDDLLNLSRTARAELHYTTVSLSSQAESVVEELRQAEPGRKVEVIVQKGIAAEGDENLLRQVLQNLLGNAWKFTSHREEARIEFGEKRDDGRRIFFVRDNGAGFDMNHAGDLFIPFRRLHTDSDFPGAGIGLSIVKRIIERHGGTIWAESEPEKGATFYFTLGE
ncbi:MAG: PAS domain-containing sensor histidine kinase [Candidatus Latescibacterota bacterium]